MNVYEKQSLLQDAIQDAERRLGSYLAHATHGKDDAYAQRQIDYINKWSAELNALYSKEVQDGSIEEVTL